MDSMLHTVICVYTCLHVIPVVVSVVILKTLFFPSSASNEIFIYMYMYMTSQEEEEKKKQILNRELME